jgi:MarR family transcriptional regulator for hemolysin
MSEPIKDFQLEQAIGLNVNRTAFLMTEEIARRFSSHGQRLSAQDFGILFRLFKQGPMTQVEIAALMMRDKTTITRRIDGLVKKQLVERSPDPDDRRYFRVDLTATGHRALDVMIPLVRDFQQEVLSDIPDEEKAITIRTLKKISDRLISLK